MGSKISMVILGAAAVWGTACGPPQLAQYAARRVFRETKGVKNDAFAAEPLRADLSAYNRLEVEPLRNEMEEKIPEEIVTGLNRQLFQQLSQLKHFQVVQGRPPDRLSESAAVPNAPKDAEAARPSAAAGPAALILRGAIVDFDAGKQTLRTLQIGAGRETVLTLHLWFVDGATGQTLGKYVINSEIYRWGSDSSTVVDHLSRGMGELVAQLLDQKAQKTPAAPVALRKPSHAGDPEKKE